MGEAADKNRRKKYCKYLNLKFLNISTMASKTSRGHSHGWDYACLGTWEASSGLPFCEFPVILLAVVLGILLLLWKQLWEERIYFTLKTLGHPSALRLSTAGAQGMLLTGLLPYVAQPAFLHIPDYLPRDGPSHSQLVSSTAIKTIATGLPKTSLMETFS